MTYVPGHSGVLFNEEADRLAGQAEPFEELIRTPADVVSGGKMRVRPCLAPSLGRGYSMATGREATEGCSRTKGETGSSAIRWSWVCECQHTAENHQGRGTGVAASIAAPLLER